MERRSGFPGQRIVMLSRRVLAKEMQSPLLNGLLIAGAGYFPKAAGHVRRRPSGTDQLICIYCVKNSGWCEMGGQRHPVGEGDLLVVPPLAPHSYGADARHPWSIYWFHAIGALIPALLKELGVSTAKPVVRMGEDPRMTALVEEILEVIEHDYARLDLLHASLALTHLLGLMVRHRHERWHRTVDVRQKVALAITFMQQHLEQPLRIPQMAALANVSSSYFNLLFSEQTGFSPREYLTRLRMHRACQLLLNTGLSIKEISAQLGYQDQFHFSRMFKAAQGVPPTDYRDTHLHGVEVPD